MVIPSTMVPSAQTLLFALRVQPNENSIVIVKSKIRVIERTFLSISNISVQRLFICFWAEWVLCEKYFEWASVRKALSSKRHC